MTPKENALQLVDKIINLVDKDMQGWLDSDIMAYLEILKQEIEKL